MSERTSVSTFATILGNSQQVDKDISAQKIKQSDKDKSAQDVRSPSALTRERKSGQTSLSSIGIFRWLKLLANLILFVVSASECFRLLWGFIRLQDYSLNWGYMSATSHVDYSIKTHVGNVTLINGETMKEIGQLNVHRMFPEISAVDFNNYRIVASEVHDVKTDSVISKCSIDDGCFNYFDTAHLCASKPMIIEGVRLFNPRRMERSMYGDELLVTTRDENPDMYCEFITIMTEINIPNFDVTKERDWGVSTDEENKNADQYTKFYIMTGESAFMVNGNPKEREFAIRDKTVSFFAQSYYIANDYFSLGSRIMRVYHLKFHNYLVYWKPTSGTQGIVSRGSLAGHTTWRSSDIELILRILLIAVLTYDRYLNIYKPIVQYYNQVGLDQLLIDIAMYDGLILLHGKERRRLWPLLLLSFDAYLSISDLVIARLEILGAKVITKMDGFLYIIKITSFMKLAWPGLVYCYVSTLVLDAITKHVPVFGRKRRFFMPEDVFMGTSIIIAVYFYFVKSFNLLGKFIEFKPVTTGDFSSVYPFGITITSPIDLYSSEFSSVNAMTFVVAITYAIIFSVLSTGTSGVSYLIATKKISELSSCLAETGRFSHFVASLMMNAATRKGVVSGLGLAMAGISFQTIGNNEFVYFEGAPIQRQNSILMKINGHIQFVEKDK